MVLEIINVTRMERRVVHITAQNLLRHPLKMTVLRELCLISLVPKLSRSAIKHSIFPGI